MVIIAHSAGWRAANTERLNAYLERSQVRTTPCKSLPDCISIDCLDFVPACATTLFFSQTGKLLLPSIIAASLSAVLFGTPVIESAHFATIASPALTALRVHELS
jgi:hypothetical protein